MLSPRLASSGTGAGGGVCPLKGGGRVFCPGCPGGGGRERGAGASQNTCHLPWVTRYLLPMLSLHDQSRGPWILLHVVSGPWTFFVAALDKGQCRKAVCRRHTTEQKSVKKTTLFSVVGIGSYFTLPPAYRQVSPATHRERRPRESKGQKAKPLQL